MCVVINFKMGQWGKNISFAVVLKFGKKLPCQENNPTGNALCFAILMHQIFKRDFLLHFFHPFTKEI